MSLPLFEYKSRGAYDYFQASLDGLVKNPILISMTLQTLKAIGNAVLVVKFISEAEKEERVFQDFMKEMKEIVLDIVGNNQDEANSVCFYKVWSSLQFLVCLPSRSAGLEMEFDFGFDASVSWGGNTILAFLDELPLAKSFSFNSHLLYISRSESTKHSQQKCDSGRNSPAKVHDSAACLKFCGSEIQTGSLPHQLALFVESSVQAARLDEETLSHLISLTNFD
ncbi:UNVERIFIED_CONTAM: hypothetical protein HDU68_007819 [Siphonaria sp. JEL0065]|nr:hypothetical protein HDU68_007819 [Siphonaria sp. JEL0065]